MTLDRNHSYLRPAVAGDLEALTDLINRAFQVERFFLVDDRVDTGRVEVSMAYGQFLVLETGSALQGAVYCEIGGALPPEVGRIGMLSVEPALQGKGLGRRLVSAAERYLRQHGWPTGGTTLCRSPRGPAAFLSQAGLCRGRQRSVA
jgi:GNAT superfamily N-acetyltransferase